MYEVIEDLAWGKANFFIKILPFYFKERYEFKYNVVAGTQFSRFERIIK